MNIEEAYISFETAKLLKEKEFDNECSGYYNQERVLQRLSACSIKDTLKSPFYFDCIPAPTQAMAMKWLREVHNIHIVPMIENNGNYIGYLYDTKGNNVQGWDRRLSKTSYEEACEAAIEYCLENLIQK